MELTHEFVVPVAADRAFEVLCDLERVAPCLPGAKLDGVEDGTYQGSVAVKLGPIQLTYRGTARFTEQDQGRRGATLEASGRETRGSGTARATVRAALVEKTADATAVTVHTNLQITGRPAQFGRGVLADVGERLLGQFAACLSDELAGERQPAAGAPGRPAAAVPAGAIATPAESEALPDEAGRSLAAAGRFPAVVRSRVDAIDLADVAGIPLLKRVLPVLVLLALLVFLWRTLRR